jgi:hypothetical protein
MSVAWLVNSEPLSQYSVFGVCGRIMPECRSTFRGRESRPITRTWSRLTERCDPSAWTRTGSRRCRRQSKSSKHGGENTMRVVLTGRWARGRRTKSLVNSRLAENSQAPNPPKTHCPGDTGKGDRSPAPPSAVPSSEMCILAFLSNILSGLRKNSGTQQV